MSGRRKDKGMGLIVAVVLLTVVAVGIGLMAPAVFQVTAADNTFKIAEDLEALKIALAGNPRLVIGGGRSDYGYVGSMGNVPADLPDLWKKSAQPGYNFDIVKKVGAGWFGPYVPSTFVNDLLAMDTDRFGTPLIYTSTPFARNGPGEDGQMVAARIRSAGTDGIAETDDDQFIDILQAEVYSTVTGTLRKKNNPVKFATVTLNVPANGVLSQMFDVTDTNGVFSFSNVTFGFRSIGIDPKLTYEEGSANVQGNDTLRFTVTNYATNDIVITSITPSANIAAYFEGIRIGNKNVFTFTGTRPALGTQINLAPSDYVTVKGSGKPTQVVPIRVEKQTTVTPDVLIKGIGKSVVVQIQELRSAPTGGTAVNPGGSTFTITFSDGSQNVFTVP
jgi:hypothetical protein